MRSPCMPLSKRCLRLAAAFSLFALSFLAALSFPASVQGFGEAEDGDRAPATVEGFEVAAAGPLRELVTEIGTWSALPGHAEISNRHSHSGKQCLHVLGGSDRVVELALKPGTERDLRLSFWAERWTRRKPFSFTVEALSAGEWKSVYEGDRSVRVGGFLTEVVISPLARDVAGLRFRCTSPDKSGLLLDDVRVGAIAPMKIAAIRCDWPVTPVLVGTVGNPAARLCIEVEGSLQPLEVASIDIACDGESGLRGIESVAAFYSGAVSELSTGALRSADVFSRSATFGVGQAPGKALTFRGAQELREGRNWFWISVRLNESVDLDSSIEASFVKVALQDGTAHDVSYAPGSRETRFGVALRKASDDGVNTYRIPGLATTKKGTLVAVYDVRHRGGGDLPGDIDVGMSRSTDGGRSWDPMRVIMDMGDDPKWRYDGVGDPAVLVDACTGTIWVAATWSHGDRSWRGSGPGMKPEQTGQLMLVRSDDDGITWSAPINITEQVKRPEWSFILQGPGKGITLRDGTIVFAAQYQDPPKKKRLPHSTIIFSKDHGETWQVGTGAFDDTTESQVVEIEPGVLMLNCRYNRKSARVVMTTRDMGRTWKRHPTSERALVEPGSCMASLIDVDRELGKSAGAWLLFSNPDSTRGRQRMTIKASRDRGQSWPEEHRLLLDAGKSAGYSCMTMVDEKTVGILYEGSQAHLTFQRIPLSDVIEARSAFGESRSKRSRDGRAGP